MTLLGLQDISSLPDDVNRLKEELLKAREEALNLKKEQREQDIKEFKAACNDAVVDLAKTKFKVF